MKAPQWVRLVLSSFVAMSVVGVMAVMALWAVGAVGTAKRCW